MPITIFLDESGDLGWNFVLPYMQGGSSRYLTIASLCIPPEKEYLARRVIRDLYKDFRWNPKKEKKWADMSKTARARFAGAAKKLKESESDIFFHAITVKKERVMERLRVDPNKLYNYMVMMSLIARMSEHDSVNFIPDPRSVKVESGNSLPEYLQKELHRKNAKTRLVKDVRVSHKCPELQFADMLCGLVRGFHENKEAEYLTVLGPALRQIRLFFPPEER